MASLSSLEVVARLSIRNPKAEGNAEFGPGVAALCAGVRDLGSLNAAAKSMGMAYSKAWRILKQTEESLGFELLARDGARGSSLTRRGQALLQSFETLNAKIKAECARLYQETLQS